MFFFLLLYLTRHDYLSAILRVNPAFLNKKCCYCLCCLVYFIATNYTKKQQRSYKHYFSKIHVELGSAGCSKSDER